MSEHPLYRLMDRPWVFRLQRAVLAPGTDRAFTRKIRHLRARLPAAQHLLDIGCGPASWLFGVGVQPLGVDLSLPYARAYGAGGGCAVVASAEALPFPAHTFDGVWSIGLLHHLPDTVAVTALREMVRVCAPGGYVVVLDAVAPVSAWRRPVAAALRRLDRGRFVRPESALLRLLPASPRWESERFTFAATGLEAVVCWACVGVSSQ